MFARVKARWIVFVAVLLVGGIAASDGAGSAGQIWSIDLPTGWTEVPVPMPPDAAAAKQRLEAKGGKLEVHGCAGPEAAVQLQFHRIEARSNVFDEWERGMRAGLASNAPE